MSVLSLFNTTGVFDYRLNCKLSRLISALMNVNDSEIHAIIQRFEDFEQALTVYLEVKQVTLNITLSCNVPSANVAVDVFRCILLHWDERRAENWRDYRIISNLSSPEKPLIICKLIVVQVTNN